MAEAPGGKLPGLAEPWGRTGKVGGGIVIESAAMSSSPPHRSRTRLLRGLARHLGGATAAPAPAPAPAPVSAPASAATSSQTATASPKLLTDAQMARYLATGFLSLPLGEVGDPLHARIHERAEQLEEAGEMDGKHLRHSFIYRTFS